MGEAQRRAAMGLQPRMHNGQQQIKVDLSKATPRACACGCLYFIQAVTVHIVSGLLSPTGQELPVQVPALVCMECKAQLPVGNDKV